MGLHNLAIELELTDDELHTLASGAFAVGFIRADPSKAWDTAEYLEAARLVATQVIYDHIAEKENGEADIDEDDEG